MNLTSQDEPVEQTSGTVFGFVCSSRNKHFFSKNFEIDLRAALDKKKLFNRRIDMRNFDRKQLRCRGLYW